MKLNCLTLVLLFFSALTFAQEKEISGKITDENKQTLPGVNILVKGAKTGTVSDMDGKFLIKVSGSNSILVIEYMGYETQEIKVGAERDIKIMLQPTLNQLDEVVLTVQAKGQKKAILDQINSNTIKNVVAGDRLQENPDANSVEAIGRLPGVSVNRNSGEGSGIVVRGLSSKYTAVTLNGVRMAGTGADGRETNISGISQYSLEGVEVFKAITADMDGNSVAGTVNLKLRETPKDLYVNVMSTSGYNSLNNDVSNFKFLAESGTRFFEDKLGVFGSFNLESANRSAQTMSAGYDSAPSTDPSRQVDLLINNTGLNLKDLIKKRMSAMVNLDYRLGSKTKLGLYGLYNRSHDELENQTKNYSATGSGGVSYGFNQNNDGLAELFQSSLSGVTTLNFMKIDYGITYSGAQTDNPNSRSWGFTTQRPQDLINTPLTQDLRRTLQPTDVPLLYDDNTNAINSFVMTSLEVASENLSDKNVDTYINLTIPIKIAEDMNLSVKTGYDYRKKDRLRDVTVGSTSGLTNQFFSSDVKAALPWLNLSNTGAITAQGFQDGNSVNDFLKGEYNFGPTFSFNQLNQVTDSWLATSQYWFDQGETVWKTKYPAEKLGLNYDISRSTLDDQDIHERYNAGYVMAEFTYKDWLMFLPGLRYENVVTTSTGFASFQPSTPGPILGTIPGSPTAAESSNEFYLPMVHLRISPTKTFYTHLSYTETLSRPQLDQMNPTSYTNSGFAPFQFIARSPYLEVEKWKNYDAQLTYHGSKIALLSVTGFYKTVNNQIWERNYTRIKGDPIIEPFPDAALVNVRRTENHTNEINLKGAEFELQTSFGYLDNWFKYFTVNLNYTYTESSTVYPISNLKQISIPDPNGGRPQVSTVRIDSTVAGPMTNQPKHIANASLGFNKKGLNVWASFQYNGGIITEVNNQFTDLYKRKLEFYRFDLQVSQKLYGVFKGFQIIGNFANLNDIIETSSYVNDPRALSRENYGWTMDLGIRYTL